MSAEHPERRFALLCSLPAGEPRVGGGEAARLVAWTEAILSTSVNPSGNRGVFGRLSSDHGGGILLSSQVPHVHSVAPRHPLIHDGGQAEMGSAGVRGEVLSAWALRICVQSGCASGPGGWEGHMLGRVPRSTWKMGGSGNVLCHRRHANSWPPHPLHPPPPISSVSHKSISDKTGAPPSPHMQPHPTPPPAQRDFKCWPWWEASSRCPLPGPEPLVSLPHNLSIRAPCIWHRPFSGDAGSPDL